MSTDDTITAWGNHVDGAVALTKMRGTDQFSDPMSHAMFRAVRTMMITSCKAAGSASPTLAKKTRRTD
jgi:hypothetical protein